MGRGTCRFCSTKLVTSIECLTSTHFINPLFNILMSFSNYRKTGMYFTVNDTYFTVNKERNNHTSWRRNLMQLYKPIEIRFSVGLSNWNSKGNNTIFHLFSQWKRKLFFLRKLCHNQLLRKKLLMYSKFKIDSYLLYWFKTYW